MFNYTGKATVEKIDVKRGTAEDSAVAVVIAFKAEGVKPDVVASLLGADDKESVEYGLFKSQALDGDQNPRFMSVKKIVSGASFEERHALTIQGFKRVRCARVSGISVKPRGFTLSDIEFRCTVEKPSNGFVEKLAEMLHGGVRVDLIQDADLVDAMPKKSSKEVQSKLGLKDTLDDEKTVEPKKTKHRFNAKRSTAPKKPKLSDAQRREAKNAKDRARRAAKKAK